MAFFGYLMKGIKINMLKGDVIEEVASDEGAFVPGLVILLLPPLVIGLLLFLLMGLLMNFAVENGSDPQLAAALKMYGGIIKGMSASFIFLLPLMTLVGRLFNVGLFHLFAKLFKGEGAYLDYFQTVSVAGIILWLAFIPYLNILIFIWYVVVIVVITARVHNIGYGKATAAVLLPGIVIGILVFVLIMMMFIPMMMHGGAHPM